jgi:hypothetical protein
MKATRLEATLEAEPVLECQELFKEETNVDNIASSEDRYGEQRLAVRRRRGAKKRAQDSIGSRQKLSAARMRVIRRAVPAVRKGKIRKCPGEDNVAWGASRGKTLVKSQRLHHKGRRHRDTKKPSYPRTRKTTDQDIEEDPRPGDRKASTLVYE